MIDKDKLYAFFNKSYGPVTPSTNGWYNCACPQCGQDKFAFHLDYKIGKCWRGCFHSEFLLSIMQRVYGITYLDANEMIESMDTSFLHLPTTTVRNIKHSDIELPFGYVPILQGSGTLGERARRYLKGRGFDLNYLDQIGVGYCNDEDPRKGKYNFFGYIIIPFKRHGILVYYIGRDYIGNFERYKNPAKEEFGIGKSEVLFNEEALYLKNKVYGVEGWSCAATIGPAGFSYQGSSLGAVQRNMIMKSPVKELVLIPDAGFYKQGLNSAIDLINYKKVKVVDLLSYQEADLGKDVNEIGTDIVMAAEEETPYLTMATLYKELKTS